MFDDPAQEINELTMVLKQDIQGLNVQIADLQNMHGSGSDGSKQSASHSHTVVDNLRLRLKDTTKEFQEALTIRNDNLKSQTDRRKACLPADDSAQFLPVRRPRPTADRNLKVQGLLLSGVCLVEFPMGKQSCDTASVQGNLQGGADDAQASTSEQ